MNLKHARPLLVVLMASLLITVSCNDDPESKQPSFDDYEYSGALRATITSNGMESTTEGYVTVAEDGEVTIETMAGSMTGTSEQTEAGYDFTITETSGSFADVTEVAGSINTEAGVTAISGTNPGGSTITIAGELTPILQTDGGWDDLEKASAIFTHSEADLLVSITIDGITLDGLNAFYHEGGRCDAYYDLGNSIPQNVDDKESEIFCNSGTLRGIDGQPVDFTDCNTIRFVLNKNTKYTYTAEWSNGMVTSDEFTTPGGGRMIAICPTSSGGGGGGNCSNQANTFKMGSQSFGIAFTECASETDAYYLYGESSDESEVEIALAAEPTANGSYAIVDAESITTSIPAGKAAIYMYNDASEAEYISSGGGTLTVTIVNGNIQVDFCNVPMKDWESSATITGAGKLTCQ
jgi:hypothetical protein